MNTKKRALDELHKNWMDVTATAVNRVHRADGYKSAIADSHREDSWISVQHSGTKNEKKS